MRTFWKIVLLTALPIGGYWLYKKGKGPSKVEVQPGPLEEDETTHQSPARERGGVGPTAQIIEQLTDIDGVTSRVAENLVERGIKSREALLKLSEEELKSIKGIGPKRAAKILDLR
jgi:predicted flap endonuclease-1-like 5' DNA nuclease